VPASAGGGPAFHAAAQAGWEATLLEIEHQAEHWATPDHRNGPATATLGWATFALVTTAVLVLLGSQVLSAVSG
jgi:hypothetical protein